VVLNVKDDRRVGPLQKLLGVNRWLRCVDLSRPLFKLAVRRMQRGTTVNTQDLCGFLKLVLTGFFVV
jgi:hypothetical protein